MTEQRSILDEFYYTDANGNEHQIFPMKLKYTSRVNRLFLKIDDQFLYLNLPVPKLDKNGDFILDKNGEPVMDDSSYKAMIELFEIALQKSKEEIEEIVDLQNGVKILDDFRQVSSLKKKIQTAIQDQILQSFVQA